MTDRPAPKLEIVSPAPTPSDALDIEALWLDPALGDGLTDSQLAFDTGRQAQGLFPGPSRSGFPAPHRDLRAQDRGPDRHRILHSRAGNARAVGGGAPLRSGHVHLP